MKKTTKPKLLTVLVENIHLNKETGYPAKQGFVLYSAPTAPAMAKSLADSLKRVNKSYRIAEDDGNGKIVEQWNRDGFNPDDKTRSTS